MPRKKKTEAETTTTEIQTEATIAQAVEPAPEHAATETPAPEPKPRKPRKKKDAPITGVATLADLAAAYQVQMESDGKSAGTIASYGMELRLAQEELGAETPLAELTPEKVQTFYDSKRVTKLRSGRQKSQLSIDKTTRVLRLALVWAAERKIIERAPLPEVEAK